MTSPTEWFNGWSYRAKRLALAALAGALFIGASMTFRPNQSAASAPALPRHAQDLLTTPDSLTLHATGARRMLGEMNGADFRILVHASPAGPRYTIISPDGITLATDLSEEVVARDFPGLDLSTLTADVPEMGEEFHDW